MASTYLFRDAEHKKDCLIQSMQLSREMFAKSPPRNKTEHVDALLYLGMVYLIENTVSKKAVKAGRSKDKRAEKLPLDPDQVRVFLELREKLRMLKTSTSIPHVCLWPGLNRSSTADNATITPQIMPKTASAPTNPETRLPGLPV